MRELMLELLTYEPFGEFLPEEEKYIHEVLSEKKLHRPPSEVHDLFSGFHYYVHHRKVEDINWLRIWKNTYHRKRYNTSSATPIRSPDSFPLLFRKICFYIIVRGNFTDKEFAKILGMGANFATEWGISTKFRKYAEANTYSEIKISRNGVKKEYVVSAIKKLYYEAGRKTIKEKEEEERKKSKETGQEISIPVVLKNLPVFVDLFAGSATVAASVASEGCPPPVVNDYDPVMVSFAWGFTHCQSKLRKRIADFHNDLMKRDFTSIDWNYDSDAYKRYVEKIDPKDVHINPKRWDEPEYQKFRMFFYSESPEEIKRGKELAERHREFIMRTRSSYKDNEQKLKDLRSHDRCIENDLRSIDFNKLSPHSSKQNEKVLEYAFSVFYQCSFALNNKVHHESAVDTTTYSSYLKELKVDLNAIEWEKCDVKADWLINLRLDAGSLNLEPKGHFSRYLRKAKFYCKDFKDLLQVPEVPSDGIYYWDSPYFLTVGYDVDFFDNIVNTLEKHQTRRHQTRERGRVWSGGIV